MTLTGKDIDPTPAQPVIVEVHVTGVAENSKDVALPGVYMVEIDPLVPAYQFASVALDAFHATVLVYEMKGFDFTVAYGGDFLLEDPDFDAPARPRGVVLDKT